MIHFILYYFLLDLLLNFVYFNIVTSAGSLFYPDLLYILNAIRVRFDIRLVDY